MAESTEDITEILAGSGRSGRPWWEDSSLSRDRLDAQVRYVLAHVPDAAAYSGGSDGPGAMEYMYRKGVILVRDEDLERVRDVIGGTPRTDTEDRFVVDGLIAGITVVAVEDTLTALEEIDARLGVGVATPDHIFHITPTQVCPATEPENAGQDTPYPPVNINYECDGSGVLAMVVDTGFIPSLVNSKHRWLTGVTGDPETYNPANIGRYTGHGTFVAGVLRCMAPQTQVVVKGFLTHVGAICESKIIKELYLALEMTPDIISMSAGATTRYGLPSMGFEVLWERRLSQLKGTVLVCAAGNNADRGPFWPATFPWTVAVGALDQTGARAGYSNFGSWVDVYALGSELVNAFPTGVYHYEEPPMRGQEAVFDHEMALWSGTSFATPLVSGLISSRMSRTGENAREAADALLAMALHNARRGVGPVLEPGMGCATTEPERGCRSGCSCC